MKKKPSPIERKIKQYLEEMDQDFVNQMVIGRYICDFVHPEWKLIIECDGAAYHSTSEQKYKDSVRDEDLKREGYKILHLLGWQCWNKDIAIPMIKEFLTCKKPEVVI